MTRVVLVFPVSLYHPCPGGSIPRGEEKRAWEIESLLLCVLASLKKAVVVVGFFLCVCVVFDYRRLVPASAFAWILKGVSQDQVATLCGVTVCVSDSFICLFVCFWRPEVTVFG